MSRTLTWNNLDSKEKEVFLDQLGKEGGEDTEDTATFVLKVGDTMTGALSATALTSTSYMSARTLALTSTASALGTFTASAIVAGNASISGTVLIGGKTVANAMDVTILAATSTASILGAAIIGGTLTSKTGGTFNGADGTNPVLIQHTTLAGASCAPLKIVASTASQAFFFFSGAVMSTASLTITAANIAGVVAVQFNGEGGVGNGYLPIFKYV